MVKETRLKFDFRSPAWPGFPWGFMKALALAIFVVLAVASLAEADESKPAPPRVETPADRIPKTRVAGRPLLLDNATILPITGPALRGGQVLVVNGRIAALGRKLKVPADALRIDARGGFIMPGIIDAHSHIAIEGGFNEMGDKLSAEVRISDVLNHEDIEMYRALAGGVSSALVLHGSANPIGGQSQVIKLRYGEKASELVFKAAPRTIKFALGENPTRRAGYPKTRQGVMQTLRRCFTAAREYEAEKHRYAQALARGETPIPPRQDLRLEAYADILAGRIDVHCHSYRSDEILALIEVAEEFGWKIKTFQHVLEGYKVAPEIARHGAGASTFSDWWAYKLEAYDAIPQNAAVLTRAGVLTSINSDSPELDRHLNLEAAKSARYGGLDELEILKMITLNPAIQLGVGDRVGSLEPGKDADFSIWNGHPLSIFSRCVMMIIDGELRFEDWGPRGADAPELVIPKPRAPIDLSKIDPSRPIVIRDALIHPISAPSFQGSLVIHEGRVESLGRDIAIPSGAQVIDAAGELQLCPGFIDAGSYVGLTEIGAIEQSLDLTEAGRYQPDWVAADAVHPHSAIVNVTRICGTTQVLTLPRSPAPIPGQGSIIRLTGDVLAEMLIERNSALLLNIPAIPAGKNKESKARKELEDFWQLALDYDRRRLADSRAPLDPKLEALRPYLRGERRVLVNANRASEIVHAVEWARARKLEVMIRGGAQAWKIARFLARRKIQVLLGPVMRVPHGEFEPFDGPYRCAAALAEAGVEFAIISDSDNNARVLPFEAGMAAAWGLSAERALRSITLAPARLLGLDKQYGSLEAGRSADLILTTGHPLEPTSAVVGMFISGRPVPLESRQTELYKRFKDRLAKPEPPAPKKSQ